MRKRKNLAIVLAIICSLTLMGVPKIEARAEDAIAATIRMAKTEGDVTVSDATGKELKQTENMRLFSGNRIETEEKSYAYMNLDDKKAVKLDAVSEAEVRKNGKKFEVLLESGNLFFNVSEKLTDEESMNLRVSNMVMGIRGTGGEVKQISPRRSKLILLSGKVACQEQSGETVEVSAGQTAEFESDEKGNVVNVTTSELKVDDIDGFALKELYENKDFAKKASEESGVDLTKIKKSDVDKKLEKEQKDTKEKIDKVKESKEKQEKQSNKVKTPVWNTNPAPEAGQKTPAEEAKDNNNTNKGNNSSNNNNGNANPQTQPTGEGAGNQQQPDNQVNPETPSADQNNQQPNNQAPPADTGSGSDSGNNDSNDNSGNNDNNGGNENKAPEKVAHDIDLRYNAEGGSLTSNKDEAVEGERVRVTVSINDGYELRSISASHAKLHSEGGGVYRFKMPDRKVTVTAEFAQVLPPPTPPTPPEPEKPDFTIETECNPEDAGVIELNSPDRAKQGTRIEFTVKANGGYEIAEVAVHDETNDVDVAHDENEGLYSFTMPAGNVKIYVWFREVSTPDYYGIGNSIDTGIANITFSRYTSAAGDLIEDNATQAEEGDYILANISFINHYAGYDLTYTTAGGTTARMAFESGDESSWRFSFTMPADDVTIDGTCIYVTSITELNSTTVTGAVMLTCGARLTENVRLNGKTLILSPTAALYPSTGGKKLDTTGGTLVNYGGLDTQWLEGTGTVLNYNP